MSRRRKRLPVAPVRARIESLSHEGRGVAHVEGKVVFISRALPGEEVMFRYTQRRSKFDLGDTVEVLTPSPQRSEPVCAHFGVCGGCSLQHLAPERQILVKQDRLLENLQHLGKVTPAEVLPPLRSDSRGYRRKARLGVHFMRREQVIRVGFRERASKFLTDAKTCEVLHPAVGQRLEALAEMINRLSVRERIPQVEVAVGDELAALVFRHLAPLATQDLSQLADFGQGHGLAIFTQAGGPDTVTRLWPPPDQACTLSYRLPAYDVELRFEPGDFTQVNAQINRAMVDRALALLELQPSDRVLDLFCGLGNFSLPLARYAASVVGVEGDPGLVLRARDNAARNQITNVRFYSADLSGALQQEPWFGQGFDKLLLDPPRSGAARVVEHLVSPYAARIVYVSCDPATLARDAGVLVNRHGYHLARVGVMDMFPHTAHVESIALFTR